MYKKMRQELVDWIIGCKPNVAMTLSLQKASHIGFQQYFNLTSYMIKVLSSKLRDRFTRRVVTRKKYDSGTRIPFVVFTETGTFTNRKHLHVATKKPDDMSLDDFKKRMIQSAATLDWVVTVQEVKEIHDDKGWIFYCSKNGLDSFLPESSHLEDH